MTVSPGPDQSRDTPGARRPRELTLIEALRAQRLLNKRARQRVDGTTFVVWTMLLDSTLGFQQVRASHFHAYLAAEANTTSKTVSRAIKALVSAGLIAYEPGHASEGMGKNVPSQFTILNVREVLAEWSAEHSEKSAEGVPPLVGAPPATGVPPRMSPSVPPPMRAPSPHERPDGVDTTGCTVSPEVSTYRGENVTGKNLTGRNDGEGAQVLALKPAHPTPSHADAQEVLDAYCAAMGESGAPVVKAKALLAPIRAALSAGYSAPMVLIGLGMWEAEGFRSPRQIEEWVEKAARQGGEPQTPTNASDLLGEGRERYRRYLARRELATPSKAEVRRTRSAAELQAFAKRAP